ncbi:S1 family peptidase [Crossiella sp. SN42]|uniref:S1 family peptidase n=1 Tax=Crossiella sp. SN42 TaxID=2944808 RepID=UPI00207C1B06|nr:S1 family peptidase [Crossiella sp. SN42]MCO1577730.1 S1 family peptidase [Crossiella sp. SN42]
MSRRLSALLVAAFTTMALSAAVAPSSAGAPAEVDPGLFAALQRDLGLSADQARARLAVEDLARSVRKRVAASADGGSWLGPDGRLVAGVTSQARAEAVRQAGGIPKLVSRAEPALDAVKSTLDSAAAKAPDTVHGWYVDVAGNSVVVRSRPEALAAARAFVLASGAQAGAVRFESSLEQARPLIDVVGGNAYNIGSGSRCSVGFSVTGGFVTAGHCGNTGASTSNPSGTFRGSSFPGNDYAWVQVAAGNTPVGAVNNYSGGRVAVAGSQDAPVGSTVCRSGSTTGWHCGTIQARNSSVTYPQGTVSGLIQTSVCAEPGDSGGSLLAGNQAQGVTSGGSGNCRSGGTTYFQPVNEILQTYGLTLLTEGGNPPPGGECGKGTYSGSLAANGSAYQPNNSYYQSTAAGTHTGCLSGPTGTDFDLYLQKWNGSAWADVAESASPGNTEKVSYAGTAGYYRYRVHAYSGSGSYTLTTGAP